MLYLTVYPSSRPNTDTVYTMYYCPVQYSTVYTMYLRPVNTVQYSTEECTQVLATLLQTVMAPTPSTTEPALTHPSITAV